MSKETVKTQIDTDITNKTTTKSISPSNVGSNMKAVVDLIPDANYKVYTAILNQSGTNNPTVTVLQNSLGGNIVWTRFATGSYKGTLSNTFTVNKTYVSSSLSQTGNDIFNGGPSFLSPNSEIDFFYFHVNSGNFLDDITNAFIEIKVYN